MNVYEYHFNDSYTTTRENPYEIQFLDVEFRMHIHDLLAGLMIENIKYKESICKFHWKIFVTSIGFIWKKYMLIRARLDVNVIL